MKPFDYVNSINYNKKDIMVDDIAEKQYNAFIINRSLSYFPDTVHFANEMNKNNKIDAKMQYSFLINIIRKRKRFSKWHKPEKIDAIQIVKEYYGYSDEKASQVVNILSSEQLNELKMRVYKGGRKK